jgi:acyl-CoA synthetase (AMP-forming)/AMP-acid ligase II
LRTPADPLAGPPRDPPGDPVTRAFDATVRRAGSAPLFASPARSWSAGDLDRHARALAARLGAAGVVAGDAVALAAPNGPAFAAGFLAARRLGAVPILCDTARPTPDRLAAIDALGATLFLAPISGWPDAVADWQLDRRAPAGSRPLDPAWGAIKLTSGSTGEPRGIAVPSEALLADDAQLASTMALAAGERILAAVPFAHSYGFSSLLLPALVRGSLLVVPEPGSPLAPLAAARALGATFFPTVPAFVAAWARLADPGPWPSALRRVVTAGAPLAPEVAAAFREKSGVAIRVFYGASECGGISFDRTGEAALRGTVGSAVDGVELALDGRTGRLRVRSRAVAARTLPEPSPDLGQGEFLTGDLAVFEGGEVRLLGRADDVVIVRGRNVHPREVEAALRSIPGVEEAVVFGADGPDGPRSLLRAVVAAPAGGLDAARVLASCRQLLAEHKVPRSLRVVTELPRTERGKLDRAALALLGG